MKPYQEIRLMSYLKLELSQTLIVINLMGAKFYDKVEKPSLR